MAAAKEFTPWDFLKLLKELNEHEAELKIKLAQAGVVPRNSDAAGKAA